LQSLYWRALLGQDISSLFSRIAAKLEGVAP
jgi:hypothetical protein